jgi:hypothetical protein
VDGRRLTARTQSGEPTGLLLVGPTFGAHPKFTHRLQGGRDLIPSKCLAHRSLHIAKESPLRHSPRSSPSCHPRCSIRCSSHRSDRCGPSRPPRCGPGYGTSSCPRCPPHYFVRCSPRCSDRCGRICCPCSSDRCSPDSGQSSFPNCSPSCSIYCLTRNSEVRTPNVKLKKDIINEEHERRTPNHGRSK